MKSYKLVILGAAVAIVATSRPSAAQSPEAGQFVAGVPFNEQVDIMMSGPATGGANIQFMTTPLAFDTQTVTDAPYSADAVTEVVQVLADGNRIARQSKVEISRDSAGRTRRVQGFSMFGPVINDQHELRHVQITDPQTQTTIMLDLQSKTAHTMPAPSVRFIGKIGTAGHETMKEFTLPALPPPGQAGNMQFAFSAGDSMTVDRPAVEKLGTQIVEGVEAEGIRTTYTIAAGAIGNQLPITITSERWTSPALKVLILSRQSDPRFGETTYRLTNINRSEPSPDLFQIPADFTVIEPQGLHRNIAIKKHLEP